MFKRILVAYDGSDGARRALITGLSIGKDFGSQICAVSVEGKLPRYAATLGEVDEVEHERRAYFDEIQVQAKQLAQDYDVDLGTVVEPGAPAETIVKCAREGGYDLIVMGHKGHSRLHEYLVGATTDRVAHLAPCSVLIVR